MTSLIRRMLRAALLDWRVYEEVEQDRSATAQAITVVFLSSVAGAVGSAGGLRTLPFYLISFVAAWCTWAALTYWIGTRVLPSKETAADFGQLLRTIGFAGTPSLLLALGVISSIRVFLFWFVLAWVLVAMVIAVRQALDYTSTLKALFVCFLGAMVHLLVLFLATTSVS